ncbi:MAG: hypothetical protein Kow0022_02290 [Phycisphaerales bacterium]
MGTEYRNSPRDNKLHIESVAAAPRACAHRRDLALGVVGVLITAASSAAGADSEAWLEVAGRTHPMLVHFPIALLAAACFFELVRIAAGRSRPSAAALGCLVLALIGSVGAGTSGWLLAENLGRAGETEIELHRWIAIGGASLACMSLILSVGARHQVVRRLYVLCLWVGALSVGVAGHFGGELVYGKGYVLAPLRPKPQPDPVPVIPEDPSWTPISFDRDVLPILTSHCIECHGEQKQKGKLRLDSASTLEASPHFDEVVVPGDPASSLLYELITLPPDDPDFMPKDGDPLSPWQIETIRAWIERGAVFDASTPTPAETPREHNASSVSPGQEVEAAIEQAAAAVQLRGGYASRVAVGVPELLVNYSIVTPPITEQDIAVLLPAADHVVELNVGGVGVTDAVMSAIGQLRGLRSLNISRSQVTIAGLERLRALARLEVLNIYGCSVGEDAVDVIARMPMLKRVYVWQTGMDAPAVQRLRALRPELEVIEGEPAGAEPEPSSPGGGGESTGSPQAGPGR